ncbi:exosortase/archaeosortase family protein [Rariglobus hedericola]|uniref:Exosortase/archaeosortase family protein n=1 Tax=Rariglobus hedericola TaxID=2597822 RepID=A0A556QKN5_9BACT|nr:exosortase/archaeosortase family protein [Rariglobus hedericola]TSJ77213.1 exosortase/archaeosortase family protein [Rariglobus hedericola]
MSVGSISSRAWLPSALYVAGIVLTVAIAGRSLGQAWTLAPDLGHGWALPWLMGWLLWERLSTNAAAPGLVPPAAWRRPLIGAAIGGYALVRLLLEPFPLWPVLLWVLAGLLYVFLLLAARAAGGNPWMRVAAGPLALVFTVVPWPGFVENTVILPLRELLATGVAEVLNFVNVPAYSDGATIHIGSGPVGVDEACGGLRSLQTSLMIAWFVGEVARMRWVRRGVLLVMAVLAAITGNFLRALVLTWVTDSGGMERLHAWHDPAGYIALVCTLVVVAVLGWAWRSKDVVVNSSPMQWPVLSWKQARGALLALTVCVVVEAGVRGWYASADKPVPPPHGWVVQWPESAEAFKRYPIDAYAQEMLKPDSFESASWRARGLGDRSGYYIGWDGGLSARNAPFIHSPEICMPMTGGLLVARGAAVNVQVGQLELPFESYEFSRRGRLLHIFRVVWNPDEGRSPIPPVEPKSRWEWFGQQWKIVTGRNITVRAQVMAFSIAGASDQAEAERLFREEIARIVVPDRR